MRFQDTHILVYQFLGATQLARRPRIAGRHRAARMVSIVLAARKKTSWKEDEIVGMA